MRLCIFEDSAVAFFEPLTLTRPAFALRLGAQTLLERQRRMWQADEVGAWVRPSLFELCRMEHPQVPVNDGAWVREAPLVFVNARWLTEEPTLDVQAPQAGLVGKQLAYLVVPAGEAPPQEAEAFDNWLLEWAERLPKRTAPGRFLNYLWDFIDHNGDALCGDEAWFRAEQGKPPASANVAVVGPGKRLILAQDASVEPFVTADVRRGPVLIDRGAYVHSFTRLEGPCYVGQRSQLMGAKLRAGTTLGPGCRIGGEVEASIILGNSNKYHDGFLGHSYLGEWVNLAAGTQTSDLRNDYEQVRAVVAGKRVATGSAKVGSFLGDHTKTGLGAIFNSGSVVGAFANVLPAATYAPKVIPSFCQVNGGQLQELWDLRKLYATAATVMARRGSQLSDVHKDLYYALFDQTAGHRRKLVRDSEYRRTRRSV